MIAAGAWPGLVRPPPYIHIYMLHPFSTASPYALSIFCLFFTRGWGEPRAGGGGGARLCGPPPAPCCALPSCSLSFRPPFPTASSSWLRRLPHRPPPPQNDRCRTHLRAAATRREIHRAQGAAAFHSPRPPFCCGAPASAARLSSVSSPLSHLPTPPPTSARARLPPASHDTPKTPFMLWRPRGPLLLCLCAFSRGLSRRRCRRRRHCPPRPPRRACCCPYPSARSALMHCPLRRAAHTVLARVAGRGGREPPSPPRGPVPACVCARASVQQCGALKRWEGNIQQQVTGRGGQRRWFRGGGGQRRAVSLARSSTYQKNKRRQGPVGRQGMPKARRPLCGEARCARCACALPGPFCARHPLWPDYWAPPPPSSLPHQNLCFVSFLLLRSTPPNPLSVCPPNGNNTRRSHEFGPGVCAFLIFRQPRIT